MGDDIIMLIFFMGLGLFLLGLEGSKKGLNHLASKKVKLLLARLENHIFLNLLIGIFITAILQSSSAVIIIVIGLIEAGLISFKPALAIILGANIGTTFTVQIISLPVVALAPYLILLGFLITITGLILRKNLSQIGITLFSLGVVFLGLNLMTTSFQNQLSLIILKRLLSASAKNKFLGILLGTFVTAIIQSSSAVTGIIISLARNNLITLPTAIAIALGSNIGTCITAFLAGLNSSSTSKSLAKGHFLFNLVGVILLVPFLEHFALFVSSTNESLVRQIANAHTLFNLFNVCLVLPFLNPFVRFLKPDGIES